jgi:hypothetical protein
VSTDQGGRGGAARSIKSSTSNFRLKLREAEKKFSEKRREQSDGSHLVSLESKRKGYEQPIGCVSCPRCLKKMIKVDGIDKVIKTSKKYKKGKRPPWDDSFAFNNNYFKDAIKELTKKRSTSIQDLKNKTNFSMKDLPKYKNQLRNTKSVMGK